MNLRYFLMFFAGAGASVVSWPFIVPAKASDPTTYTCTAVKIPITKGKRTEDPEAVVEQVLPAGYVPYGGGSGGYSYQGSGSSMPYVIACRTN